MSGKTGKPSLYSLHVIFTFIKMLTIMVSHQHDIIESDRGKQTFNQSISKSLYLNSNTQYCINIICFI